MLSVNSPETMKPADRPWWREGELWLLVIVVLVAYGTRLPALPFHGEEPRRAQVAREHVWHGDWVVPREQGEPFLSRPPLQNWLIAWSFAAFGQESEWAARLPSMLALLLTAVLVYGYGRTFLSRLGALAAALALATFPELLTTGCQAETESVFILFVAASLIGWHWGLMRGWPEKLTWLAGYLPMALAFLTKGPQAPAYFGAAVGIYLLVTNQFRRLFTRAHVIGAAAAAALVLGWAVPYYFAEGWSNLRVTVFGDTGMRFDAWKMSKVLQHLCTFPLEVLGCMLPWSLLLLAYLNRDFRRSLGAARPQVLFLGICLLVAVPTIWVPPSGQTRYLVPIYPCFALLIGLVVERCASASLPRLHARWSAYLAVIACLMVVFAAAVLAGSLLFANHPRWGVWTESTPLAAFYAVTTLVLAIVIWRHRTGASEAPVRTALLALSAFAVLTWLIPVANLKARRMENTPAVFAQVRPRLHFERPLISFGHIDARFAFYYRLPITPCPFPPNLAEVDASATHFCIFHVGPDRPQLPFAWEEVAAISMDRNHRAAPESMVIVGRFVRQPDARAPATFTSTTVP